MKNFIIAIVIILLIGIGGYFFLKGASTSVNNDYVQTPPTTATTTTPPPAKQTATSSQAAPANEPQTVIGTSAGGNPITAYHYGTGTKEILFVGGIHGGYEWNTVLVAYQLMDYLAANPSAIPSNERITVIPVLNPDGLAKVTGSTGRFTAADIPTTADATVPGRFNANTVDLNRNFDCEWSAKAVWQNTTVSGGTASFSEPETVAIRNYVAAHQLTAAVVWYSAAGGVYSSNCHNGVLPETATLTSLYANASGYPAHESFDFYAITGDMVNWLASKNVPAISVLLTNHTDTEWDKNLKGIQVLLAHYAK